MLILWEVSVDTETCLHCLGVHPAMVSLVTDFKLESTCNMLECTDLIHGWYHVLLKSVEPMHCGMKVFINQYHG